MIAIRSTQLSAQIDPLGAQLSSLRDSHGNELLWHGDPAFWAGRAPILFPIVGMLAGGSYACAGQRHALPRHGFARGKQFTLVQATPRSVLFRLCEDAATLAVYPFAFELDVAFSLMEATLSVTASVRNTGSEDLPASLGFHPGLRWPLPYGQERGAHWLEFPLAEGAPVRRITSAGLLSAVAHATPVTNRRLELDDALFRDDVLIFDRLQSRSLIYGGAHGPQLEIAFPDATYVGVWSKPGAPFVCIEPWQGVADPEGFEGDIWRKPGILRVEPDGFRVLRMTIGLA
jgi:galactose mutarotase-like enzyme